MHIPKRLTVRVNLDAVLKEHIYNGKKGKYLNLVLFNTPENQFGDDYVVKQDIAEDQRPPDGAPILGNAKAWNPDGGQKNFNGGQQVNGASPAVAPPAPPAPNANDDGLPF